MLIRRAKDPFSGAWDIPGGFCEPSELPKDAAVREVYEETGLHIVVERQLGMWIDRYHCQGGVEDTLNVYFLAVPLDPVELRPDPDEVIEIGWFTPEDVPGEIAFPNHAPAVIDEWRADAG